MDRDSVTFPDDTPEWSNPKIPEENRSVLIATSNSASGSNIVGGSLTMDIEIEQRKYPGPDWPSDLEFEEWAC